MEGGGDAEPHPESRVMITAVMLTKGSMTIASISMKFSDLFAEVVGLIEGLGFNTLERWLVYESFSMLCLILTMPGIFFGQV